MNTTDAVTFMAGATFLASIEKASLRKSDGDPVVNIATLSYWDGVSNLANKLVEVLDGKTTHSDAMRYISDYVSELRQVLQEELREERDAE